MRITIDAVGSDVAPWVAPWVAALRAQAQGEEIQVFESGKLAAVLGASWLDFKLRGTDVFHASAATPCAPRSAKLTATIEDLSGWLIPGAHTKAAQHFAEKILERAHGLIAVSESVRQDAIRLLGIDETKITTIYPGVAPEYFDAKAARRERSYVLYASGDTPRQNREALLAAWRDLKPELQREYDLISTSDAPGAEPMAGAALFVYPSLYDGFALPVAQAMAAHVAVVTSDVSSMPEVGRDAAFIVDPHDPAEIAAGITRLLESESERAKLARYGRARAEKYRWEKCAEDSLAFFRRVAGG
ncbi:MAG TPA: glycosyltransferase family 1 protein [Bryobacteraceae bacterium]|nr:glycosyltransferase family 1 protein [Bryobacteraceae bacterium]